MYCIRRVLFMSDSSIPVWGHSAHVAKLSMLRFSKGCCSYSFYLISIKLYAKYGNRGGGEYIIWRSAQNSKCNGTLTFLLTQNNMGVKISKHNSYSFHAMSAKPCEDISYHGRILAIKFLGNKPSLNF